MEITLLRPHVYLRGDPRPVITSRAALALHYVPSMHHSWLGMENASTFNRAILFMTYVNWQI
jgi:hypothetical protein